MAESHFVVLRQEQIGALAAGVSCADLDAALALAQEKTASDSDPRYVLQVVYHVAVDPRPRVIVTRFDAAEAA